MILETGRLSLRKMEQSDYIDLCKILRDREVMYAYEHAFSEAEAHDWLDHQIDRYAEYGFGLWAVLLRETGELIGQCGITMQDIGDDRVMEVGYLFRRAFWHRGYATEAALACRDYAFEHLAAQDVYAIIRDSNTASQRVAERSSMRPSGEFSKHYYNMDMPHIIYKITRQDWEAMKKMQISSRGASVI